MKPNPRGLPTSSMSAMASLIGEHQSLDVHDTTDGSPPAYFIRRLMKPLCDLTAVMQR